MKKINSFIEKHSTKIILVLVVLIFLNTCGNPTKSLNRRVDTLSNKIDSLSKTTVTKKELSIEGLKAEKRMIQSTDRKMLDVTRQSQIDKEISALEK
jgi:ABC-type phosphate transport system auxiliary subunit